MRSRAVVVSLGFLGLLVLPAGAQTDDAWRPNIAPYTVTIPDHRAIAQVIGLQASLAQAKLPSQAREVRLWVSGPGPILKSRLLRLVEVRDSLSAELVQYWQDREAPTTPGSASRIAINQLEQLYGESNCKWDQTGSIFRRQLPDQTFEERRGWFVACLLPLSPTRAESALRSIDELSVWDLPSKEIIERGSDGSITVRHGADGTSITGETLNGATYHGFYWHNPATDTAVGAAAASALIELVFELEDSIRPATTR